MRPSTIFLVGLTTGALLIAACQSLVMDRSVEPVLANDKTLALSACQPTAEVGFSACRVQEGTAIGSVWRLYFPVSPDKSIAGGEVTVYFNDVPKSYAITGPLLEIPWADFFQDKTWKHEYDGTASALAVVRYKDQEGIEETVKAVGEARVMVIKAGYDPMPIHSAFATFETVCKIKKEDGSKSECLIEYSTVGRSAVECHAK